MKVNLKGMTRKDGSRGDQLITLQIVLPEHDEDFADCRTGGELRRYSLAHARALLRQPPPGCVAPGRPGAPSAS